VTVPEVLTATVRIAAPPADVFRYFVDPLLMVQWIGEWADLRPEPGGVFALDFATTPVRGEYVEVDPPRRVVFTWGVAGKDSLPPGSTTVEVVLTADGSDTVVELFHHDLPPAEFDNHGGGWTSMLDRLAGLAVWLTSLE
jgi:uncharacterized protein YndB with AHSA1/START domain